MHISLTQTVELVRYFNAAKVSFRIIPAKNKRLTASRNAIEGLASGKRLAQSAGLGCEMSIIRGSTTRPGTSKNRRFQPSLGSGALQFPFMLIF